MLPRKHLRVAGLALSIGLGASGASAQKIYWADPGEHRIQRANLDGSQVEDLVISSDEGWLPEGIGLDLVDNKMYWVDWGGCIVYRANLRIPPGETAENRTDIEGLVTGLDPGPTDIALNLLGGKMYWPIFAGDRRRIERTNLDGSGKETLLLTEGGSNGVALNVDEDYMYWSAYIGVRYLHNPACPPEWHRPHRPRDRTGLPDGSGSRSAQAQDLLD